MRAPAKAKRLKSSEYFRLKRSPDRPSQAQLFGRLSIYSLQQKSERLGRDLSKALFQNEDVLQVLLVLRDGCTEDSGLEAPNKTSTFRRFYRPSFLLRYRFLTKANRGHQHKKHFIPQERRSVVGWISLFCDDTNIRLKPFTEKRWMQIVRFVEDEDTWYEWQKPQEPREAFERLVSAFSCLNYAGATPSKLDEHVPATRQFAQTPCYPIYHVFDSHRDPEWIKVKRGDLYRQQQSPLIIKSDGNDKLSVATTEFFRADKKQGQILKKPFLQFLDPFFSGHDKPRKQVAKKQSFRGLAFPLFDRWDTKGPVGAFVGWVFLTSEKAEHCESVFKSLLCGTPEAQLRREILRANFNDYAESLAEYVLGEEISRYNPSQDGEPTGYFRKRFHHVEGWTVKVDDAEQVLIGEVPSGELFQVNFDEHRQLKDLHVRLDSEHGPCVVLEPKFDTIAPMAGDDRIEKEIAQQYYERIANWARSFWQSLKRYKDQDDVGRSHAALTAYSATAHQLRKLVRGIAPETAHDELVALRRYFMVTFLSRKDLEGKAIWFQLYAETTFGKQFLDGKSFKDFVLTSLDYAKALFPILIKHRTTSELAPNVCAPELQFDNSAIWNRRLWNHKLCAYRAVKDIRWHPTSDDTERLVTKACFFCAFVALWLNVLEHSDASEPTRVCYDKERRLVTVENKADSESSPKVERSKGTLQTLQYYLAHCGSGVDPDRVVFAAQTNNEGWFETGIPIPQQLFANYNNE